MGEIEMQRMNTRLIAHRSAFRAGAPGEVAPRTLLVACVVSVAVTLAAPVWAKPLPQVPDEGEGTPFEEPEGGLDLAPATSAAGDVVTQLAPSGMVVRRTVALRRFLDSARRRGEVEEFDLAGRRAQLSQLPESPPSNAPPPRGGLRGGSAWAPYAGPFGVDEAGLLLHRTMIGPRFDEIREASNLGLGRQVGALLKARKTLPARPASWAYEPFPDITNWSQERVDSLYKEYWDRRDPLRLWWAQVMLDDPVSVREAMTLFWHDHFATGISKVWLPQSMYVQNQLLRKHATGNFKTLVKEVARDPAMLIWLDGIDNRADYLNENWARELLELFTMGVGNYSQSDVVAAARAFTGWTTLDGLKGYYVPAWHDNGQKTFLGRTGNWNGDQVIDIIFQQPVTARFICRKLYRYFLDEYPDEAAVEELAAVLRANNYELRPVLQKMFLSARFMDPNYRGALIADPVDRTVGAMRSLYVDDIDLIYDHPEWHSEGQWLLWSMNQLGMVLFEPPNVGGWPGYRTWLNSITLPWRKELDVALVDGEIWGWDLSMQSDVLAMAEDFSNPNDAQMLVSDLSVHLFGMRPTDAVSQRLLDELLQGTEPWEWSLDYPEAESRLRGLVRLALRLPDYQLK